MANPNMKVSVLVQLIDRLTAPLRGLTRGISATATAVGNLGRKIGIVGASLAALSFAAPIQQAAAWDAQLRDIAITAGKTGGAVEQMIAETSRRYEKLALETGQRSMDIAKGAQLLVAAGMDSGLIDKLMPTIARVATAANATIEDTSKTAFALSETLKIPADQMEAALGKLVTAGKLGRFEFKNMAAEFPNLTAQMAKFGITGMEAVEHLGSSLQIAMLGTANPSEAANNLKNFLTKINAPEAIKKFEKELKVDVTGVMTDAAAKGINPVEAVVQKLTDKLKVPKAEIDKIMKNAGQSNMSDKEREATIRKQVEQLISGSKIGKIYADMQVLDFLIPTLLNVDKFKDFKRQLKESGVDVIAQDFDSRMRGLSQQMLMFSELGTQAMRRIGLTFASNLPAANRAITELLKWVSALDAKWPGLVDGVLSWTGALLALGAAIAILTPVFSALAALLGVIFSPIGLIVAGFAALGAAAYFLYQSWEAVVAGLKRIWEDVVAAYTALYTALSRDISSAWTAMLQAATAAWDGIKAKGVEFLSWAQALPAQLTQIGAAAIQGLWDGMASRLDAMIAWLQAKWATITGLFKLPSFGGALPGSPGGSGVDPMGNPTGTITPGSAPGGGIGGSAGFTRTAGGPAANSNMQIGGRIVVEAAEGSRVVNVQSENPAVAITPNRGSMLGRA
jgi:TP901 family phage tail tape measure protein